MPSLAGAVTLLTALAVSGSATTDYTKSVVSTPRPDDVTYTQLSTNGQPGMPYGAFTGRAASTESAFNVDVSLVPVLALGDIADIDIDLTISAVPVVTVAPVAAQSRGVDVSLVPAATWTLGGLTKTGDTAKAATASVVPVVTVGTSLIVDVTQAISLVPALTFDSGTLGISDNKTVDVSIVPSASLEYQVNIALGALGFTRNVDIVPVVNVTASVAMAGDVDRIKTRVWPVGRIKTRIT
jgi:hypothetical protein